MNNSSGISKDKTKIYLTEITSNQKLVNKNELLHNLSYLSIARFENYTIPVSFVFIYCLRRPEQLNGILPATTVQFSYYEWLISIHTQWDNKFHMYVSVSIFSVSKGPYQSKNCVCKEGCVSVHTVSKSIFFTRNTCVRRSFLSAWGCLVYRWKVCSDLQRVKLGFLIIN